jgi:class 3 adenylate cyclase
MVRAALEIVSGNAVLPIEASKLRIGINCGPVIAGVMGGSRLSYDVWGDTVNVAARMEEHSHPGRILCTNDVAQKLAQHQEFAVIAREPLDIRGKGLMTTYWVSSSR